EAFTWLSGSPPPPHPQSTYAATTSGSTHLTAAVFRDRRILPIARIPSGYAPAFDVRRRKRAAVQWTRDTSPRACRLREAGSRRRRAAPAVRPDRRGAALAPPGLRCRGDLRDAGARQPLDAAGVPALPRAASRRMGADDLALAIVPGRPLVLQASVVGAQGDGITGRAVRISVNEVTHTA